MSKSFKFKRLLNLISEDAIILLKSNPPVLLTDSTKVHFINRKRENSHLLYFEFVFTWEGGLVLLFFPKTETIEFLQNSKQKISIKKDVTIQVNRRTGEVFEVWS